MTSSDDILERLRELRAHDAPTHGGRLLSYVYDSGRPDLDDLAAAAVRAMQPVNGLDPTAFASVATIERELVAFALRTFSGGDEVVGSATSGGTESCLLAAKTARDAWRARVRTAPARSGRPRLLAPTTVHAAFHKAAELFDFELDLVSVDPASGTPSVERIVERLGPDVALTVLSAPSYPFAALDPIADVASAALAEGVDLHVDACIGGFALAFWPDDAPGAPGAPWDFRLPGVTSLSADLHKYGYAPKGVSVLLQRGRDRQRHQWFATSDWPGYPVVNPTLLGSRSAGPLAAAWAITQRLGASGFGELTASMVASRARLVEVLDGIPGLSVVGRPTGPLLAVAADPGSREAVDPHLWADALRESGFVVQGQPAYRQPDGTLLPPTAHLTITPVTERILDELGRAAIAAADGVRGVPHLDGGAVAEALLGPEALGALASGPLDAAGASALLASAGLDRAGGLDRMAPVLALVETLPDPVVRTLLVEVLASRLESPRG